jgi:hypothetical protein
MSTVSTPASAYSRIAHAFIELRGKGLSLCATDLDVLRAWHDMRLPPVALLELLFALAQECDEAGKGFPLTLKAVDTRVRRALRDGQLTRFLEEGSPSHEHFG